LGNAVPYGSIHCYTSNSATIERYTQSGTILALLLQYEKNINLMDDWIFTGQKANAIMRGANVHQVVSYSFKNYRLDEW
jgi:hypothetical protein